jgi:two-component system, NtrC family, sensor kinase
VEGRSPTRARIEALLEREGDAEALAELRRIEAAATPAGEQARTITELTRALLESEKTYRLVFSHELDPMSLFDPESGRFLDVNDAWVRLYGYSREEALTMRVTEVSAEPAETRAAIRGLPSGASTRVAVRWHKAKDGTVFPVELTAGKLRLGGREVTYAVMRDIKQRDDDARALERSVASFRSLIESIPDAVIVHRHGRLVYMNPSARRMLGYAPEDDVRDLMALELVHPDDREKVLARVVDVMAHGKAAPLVEERLVRRDGTSVLVEIAALSTMFEGEVAVLAIARDITLRKEIESRLVMNDRLASIGRLSASVGHELNNPLAYVLGNVEMMSRVLARATDLPAGFTERFAGHLGMVREGAERMRDVVHDLTTLARAEGGDRVAVDVQHILEVALHMAEPELRGRAKVVTDYRETALVTATEALLGQVFLNLLLNAAQAIPPGEPAKNEVCITLRNVAGRAEVEVADTGAGVSPADLDRIFEPFFTTKEGSGGGLGLSISHQIVTGLGGTLQAANRPGRGMVFCVTLPAAGTPP